LVFAVVDTDPAKLHKMINRT